MKQHDHYERVNNATMTHAELVDHGCEFCIAEDRFGDTRSGYWLPGDGEGQGYGDFLGETPEAATIAIRG